MGKPLPLSRKLEEEQWLVRKLGGECVSGFSERHMVKTLALGTQFPCLEVGLGRLSCPSQLHTSSLGRLKIQMDSGGVKGQSRNSCCPPGDPLPPHRGPTCSELCLGGPCWSTGVRHFLSRVL